MAASGGVRIANVTRHRVSLPLTLQAPWRFQMVGLRWRGSGQVEVRAALGRTWTRWLPGSQEAPAWVGAADRVQLRRSGAGPVHRLRVSFIDTPPQPAAGHGLMPATTLRPAIIRRAGWGANESLRRAPPEYAPALKMVFVHHTDTASVYPCSDSARIVRGIYAYHVLANGWNDIGYNFLIDRCGRVFEGRYGGITRPVVGAHARGFNTGSAGIAMIGTFTSTPPTRAARRALRELIAWRLDLAHVDPTSKVLMTTTTGNERFPPGTRLRLRAVSGHRDTGATSCPGAALYRLLPRIAASVRRIGLPKIFDPRVKGSLRRLGQDGVAPIRFRATLSEAAGWTLIVRGPDGVVATHDGHGDAVDWTWPGAVPLLPGGAYRWTLATAGARPVRLALGTLPDWSLAGIPVAASGDVTSGGVSDLLASDGDVLVTGGTPSQLVTTDRVDLTAAQFAAATMVGASLRTAAGDQVVAIELWDYATSSWIAAGSCRAVADHRCDVLIAASQRQFGQWLSGASAVEMRVRYTAAGPMTIDRARSTVMG
jgi:N-acetylmuramoyl-L-alanine amidase